MARNRDSLFPSDSIGRTGISSLQRVPSRESLNAHPLLTSNNSPQQPTQGDGSDAAGAPRYVPYTPRHRVPSSTALPGTTTQLSVPAAPQTETGATNRLQVQNLKAAAQVIGLGSGTLGWAILEKLVESEASPEWDDIRAILQNAKPTLLLPLEPLSGEVITPHTVKEHLAICAAVSSSAVVTLTGLRGDITGGNLVIHSTMPTASRGFAQLLKTDTQTATFASLAPLPAVSSDLKDLLPSFALTGSTSLPLPPRMFKPPLPPRPGTSSSGSKIAASRIGNPFASLFGRPVTPLQQPPPPHSTAAASSLPPAVDDTQPGQASIHLRAHAIGRRINGAAVGKELSTIIRQEIKARLSSCPRWIVNRVIDFTRPFQPMSKPTKPLDITANQSALPPFSLVSDTATLEDCFQALYTSIEEDIRTGGAVYSRRKGRKQGESEEDDDTIEVEGKDRETRKNEILEQVEGAVCEIFYDRLFSPLSGDDASHDEALANRIAALNMLDLTLEHLGIEIPSEKVGEDVKSVVKACGDILQRLEEPDNHIPSRKLNLLVEAHQEVVAGLSKLPKLRLRPDKEMNEQDLKTPRASSFANPQADREVDTPEIRIQSDTPSPSSNDTSQAAEEKPESDLATEDTLASTDPAPVEPINQDSQLPGPKGVPETKADQSSTSSSELTPISGDILFPFLIFSVVKSNPPHLVSHLLFTQRFRSRSLSGGGESYCLINLMAVVEFLENVDMAALGLGESERVMSTAELSPIPIQVTHMSTNAHDPAAPVSPFSIPQLGRRVNQQVGELAELAGSANKVLTGVVDSSFGMLRGILSSTPTELSTPHDELQDSAPWNALRPGFGLLRRGSGFSIASVTNRPKTLPEEEGRPLVDVSSRSSSIKETSVYEDDYESGSNVTTDDEEADERSTKGDTRSIRSFSSMISRESRQRERDVVENRAKLADRLASMTKSANHPALDSSAKDSSPPSRSNSRPPSWLPSSHQQDSSTVPIPSTKALLQPPNIRFLECDEQDLRIGDIGELLREYRRMVQALKAANMFQEPS